ncbi:MAG TPA: hypothetical protein PLH39_11945, partial [Promineifilum sp.]|nr:hypothetical protein [Promineifilum sp.]
MSGCAGKRVEGIAVGQPPTPAITGAAATAVSAAVAAPAQPDAAGVLLPTPTLAAGLAPPASATPLAGAVVAPPPPATATPDPSQRGRYTLSAAPGVPEPLRQAAQHVATGNPELFTWVEGDPAADVRLTVADGEPLAQWVYAAAAPFATVADETTGAAVRAGWASGASELGRLLLDTSTAAALEAAWGAPTAGESVAEDFLGRVWAARPSWIIVPFEALRP